MRISSRKRTLLAGLAVALFALGLYAGSLRGGFVWDDRALVLSDARIRSVRLWPRLFTGAFFTPMNTGREASYYRPIVSLSYALDYALAGGGEERAWVYHLDNMAAYAACCLLLFLALERLAPGGAAVPLVCALAFAAHVTHVENVAWIAGRTDVQAGALMLASWLVYSGGGGGAWRPWAAAGLSLLAMLAKEVALAIVPVLVVWESVARGSWREGLRAWRRWAPACLAAGLYMAMRFAALRGLTTGLEERHFNPWTAAGAATIARTTMAYAGKIVLPVWPSAEFEITPFAAGLGLEQALSVLGGLALLVWALWALAARSRTGLALAWFGASLLPALNIVPIAETAAERFAFVPGMAAAMLLALALRRTEGGRGGAVRLGAAGAIVLCLGVSTVQYVPAWRDEFALCRRNVRMSPENPRSHLGLAVASDIGRGWPGEARAEYDWAIEIRPAMAAAQNNLGKLLARQHRPFDALRHLLTAKALTPRDVVVRHNVAEALIGLALEEPGAPEFWKLARREIDDTLRLNPGYADAWYLSGVWHLYQTGQEDRAVADLRECLRLDPAFGQAQYLAGVALERQGRKAEAAEAYRRALVLTPGLREAREALARLGRP